MWNALTVDVEDYFQTEAMSGVAPCDSWSQMPSRIERNTWKLLEIFDRHQVRTTMFFLGWVAERFPNLVKAAVSAGHEAACHGYWHRPVNGLSGAEFREDTLRAKAVIENVACKPVLGYRAPSFSILSDMGWAYEALAEMGFSYSSSCHPILHDNFSNPHAQRLPCRLPSGIFEIPITTWRIFDRNVPVAGGGYLRILPFGIVKAGLRHAHDSGEQLVVYVHPWEIDDEQPRLRAGIKSGFRQYTGLKRTRERLERLLEYYRFTTIREAFALENCNSASAGQMRMQTAYT